MAIIAICKNIRGAEMKRYHVGVRFFDLIMLLVGLVISVSAIVVMIINPNVKWNEYANAFVGLGIAALACLFGVAVYVMFLFRHIMAFKYGTEKWGNVVRVETHHRRGYRVYNAIITYENDEGEKFESSIPVSYLDKDDFAEGEAILVYVWKNYACFGE